MSAKFSHSPGAKDPDAFGGTVAIDTGHYHIHVGNYFTTGYYDDSVSDNGTVELLLKVGSKACHIVFEGATGGDCEAYAYEAPTVSANGTELNVINHNRTSSKTPTLQAYHTPTLTDDGDLLLMKLMPGGTGRKDSVGSPGSSRIEFILAPNTDYLMRMKNISGAAQPMQIMASWYEEED